MSEFKLSSKAVNKRSVTSRGKEMSHTCLQIKQQSSNFTRDVTVDGSFLYFWTSLDLVFPTDRNVVAHWTFTLSRVVRFKGGVRL